ncbi:MAG: metallophosphoesterase [Actinobacteria bacterium]|nr:metallophosphoesterase [Actinomycetota bacterium]
MPDLAAIPLRIAQISDVHVGGGLSLPPEALTGIVELVHRIAPDVVVIAGDLTTDGYEWEYEEAAAWVERFEPPTVIIPGNHDARNVGYVHFDRFFGEPFSRFHVDFDPVRAERLQASGFTIVGLDSSEPDVNEGRVGRDRYPWIAEQFGEPDDIRIVTVHHHLVSIPGTGRERNIVLDAGDLLLTLVGLDVDLVLSGHKHVPFFWGVNGMLVCNSGTAGTRRIRAGSPPSWNELHIDASTIKVFVHYLDGRRELSAIFSRKTRALTREGFYVTDAFVRSNRVAGYVLDA